MKLDSEDTLPTTLNEISVDTFAAQRMVPPKTHQGRLSLESTHTHTHTHTHTRAHTHTHTHARTHTHAHTHTRTHAHTMASLTRDE